MLRLRWSFERVDANSRKYHLRTTLYLRSANAIDNSDLNLPFSQKQARTRKPSYDLPPKMSRLSVSSLANKTKRIPAGACTPPKRASKRSTRRYQRANAAIMHAHVRYSRVLHYRQGSKLRGRTYTLVHVTYLDVLYPVPVRTRSYRNVRTRVRSVRAHVRSHRFERRTKPNSVETGRTPGSRLSRSSPDATSSQYRVSPLAELVSDLCQSRASRHSPFLPAGYSVSFPRIFVRLTSKYETVISRDSLVLVALNRADASPFRGWKPTHIRPVSTYVQPKS